MKLTKSKLKEMIAEELDLEEEELPPALAKGPGGAGGGGESEEKLKTDVAVVMKKLKGYIEKIDTYQEYGQLLNIILKHQVKGKGRVMRKLKDTYLAGMKEQ